MDDQNIICWRTTLEGKCQAIATRFFISLHVPSKGLHPKNRATCEYHAVRDRMETVRNVRETNKEEFVVYQQQSNT